MRPFAGLSGIRSAVPVPAILVRDVTLDVAAGGTASTHTVNLPASCVAGQRLIAIMATGDNSTYGWPAGWTEILDTTTGVDAVSVAYRECDGTEGASISVTTSNLTRAAALVIRVEGHTADAPELATPSTGSSTLPDCPAFDPSWAGDTLWIAACTCASATPTEVTGFPYPNNNFEAEQTAASGTRPRVGICTKISAAPSEDPGAFTIAPSDTWYGLTIAVRSA